MYKKYGVRARFGAFGSCGCLLRFFLPSSAFSTGGSAGAGWPVNRPEVVRTSARFASSAGDLPGASTVLAWLIYARESSETLD